jgi:hypothetical protein
MPMLAQGQTYDLTLKTLKEAHDQKPKSNDPSTLLYFHRLELIDDEGNDYPSQLCSTSHIWKDASPGDLISVTVTALSVNIYTIKFVKVVRKAMVKSPAANIPSNPVISGTAAAIALAMAVEHFKYKDEKDAGYTLLDKADEWCAWLISKTYPS